MDRTQAQIFDRDVLQNGGYLYTKSLKLSSYMATRRSADLILQANIFNHRRVLDLGCGDGFFTALFWDMGKPESMFGIDAAAQAVHVANQKKLDRPLSYIVGDAHHTPWHDNMFDVVMIQSILHHDYSPRDMIREAFRLAPTIIIHEPNGNNPGLKLIEQISPYHREHKEKSYSSTLLRRWIYDNGGKIVWQKFSGFVPMFFPDWTARLAKKLEPVIESTPLLNKIACAVVAIVAERGSAQTH
jgi:SAM-dependent methyltransferase